MTAAATGHAATGRLAAIRGLLDQFSGSFYEVGETRALVERIGQIAAGAEFESATGADGSAYLSPADLETALGALEDAALLLGQRALSACDDCTASPADLCEPHAGDFDRATGYRALAAKLGGAQ